MDLTCPVCNAANDAASRDRGFVPAEGDVALCWSCTEPGILEDGKLRIPTDAELLEIITDPDFFQARAAMQVAKSVGAGPAQATSIVWGQS